MVKSQDTLFRSGLPNIRGGSVFRALKSRLWKRGPRRTAAAEEASSERTVSCSCATKGFICGLGAESAALYRGS